MPNSSFAEAASRGLNNLAKRVDTAASANLEFSCLSPSKGRLNAVRDRASCSEYLQCGVKQLCPQAVSKNKTRKQLRVRAGAIKTLQTVKRSGRTPVAKTVNARGGGHPRRHLSVFAGRREPKARRLSSPEKIKPLSLSALQLARADATREQRRRETAENRRGGKRWMRSASEECARKTRCAWIMVLYDNWHSRILGQRDASPSKESVPADASHLHTAQKPSTLALEFPLDAKS
ncbi:hypothetical protein K438DRAFT_1784691 [Mycena galopus ATCC 62051]|nr:hypothetical protein K438DRAFT_1784691 [Mycena galopus ATCC 62051]